MLGAIVGDIVGSRFQLENYRRKDFELFAADSFVTDDSIMTLAVGQAIVAASRAGADPSGGITAEYVQSIYDSATSQMRAFGRAYPDAGYGAHFAQWLLSNRPEPYDSFGNGAAMRVSAAGWAGRSEQEVKYLSFAVTSPTHGHAEGLKGAEATAIAIFLARSGATQGAIRERIERHYYPLDFTVDEIRPTYQSSAASEDTVPQAIEAFLESTSFEDTIRTAVSLGGDSDTLAAISGSIAEAYFGVPENIRETALTYLDDDLLDVFAQWERFQASQR